MQRVIMLIDNTQNIFHFPFEIQLIMCSTPSVLVLFLSSFFLCIKLSHNLKQISLLFSPKPSFKEHKPPRSLTSHTPIHHHAVPTLKPMQAGSMAFPHPAFTRYACTAFPLLDALNRKHCGIQSSLSHTPNR